MLRIIFLTGEGFLATFIVIRLLQSFIFWQWYLGFDPTLEQIPIILVHSLQL